MDKNPYVLGWASEALEIPYYNPIKQRWSVYIPDFIVHMASPDGRSRRVELIEVKPLKETPGYTPISERTGRPLKIREETRMHQAVNAAKWAAAKQYCAKNGWIFRVVTEQTLYNINKS